MSNEKTLRFRPTVVVCVGERGRAVAAQLATLLPGLDPARRAGIALLEVNEHAVEGDFLYGSWLDAETLLDGRDAAAAEEAVMTPLPLLLVEALRGRIQPEASRPGADMPGTPEHAGVLDEGVVWRIQEAGYIVPKAMAVVWVVAAASSPLLKRVAEEVRRGLASERVDGWVLLALPNQYPRDPALHAAQARTCANQPWDALLVGADGRPPLATYAYLFETRGERGTFWEAPDDVPFATAEAIFVLTASGINTTREYEEMLRRSLPQMIRKPYERLSGVGTSRLTFPRAHVERYCANRLGGQILRVWARSEKAELKPAIAGEQKAEARAALAEMRGHTIDSEAVSRGGRPSPRVSAETMAEARALHGAARPAPDAGLIFRHFSQGEQARLSGGPGGKRGDAATLLQSQREKAEEGFAVWMQTIRPGWERAERGIERRLVTTAGKLALEGSGGVARARSYLDEARRGLLAERERLLRQREARALGYGRFLATKEAAAEGQWLARPWLAQPIVSAAEARRARDARARAVVYTQPPIGAPAQRALPAPADPPFEYPTPAPRARTAPPVYVPTPTPAPGTAPRVAPAGAPAFAPGSPPNSLPEIRLTSWGEDDTWGSLARRPATSAFLLDTGPHPAPLSAPALASMDLSGPRDALDPPTLPDGLGGVPAPLPRDVAPSLPAAARPATLPPIAAPPIAGPLSGPIAAPSMPSIPMPAYPVPAYPVPAYPAPAYPAHTLPPAAPAATLPPMPIQPEPAREERLLERLSMRYRWHERRRPGVAALVGGGLVAATPIVFLAQALLPAAWLARPFALLYVTLATAALVALAASGFALRRAQLAAAALEDLRAAYRRAFADRCERHEDERREALLAGLLARVRRVLDRLSRWDDFARDMAETLEAEAETVERSLFDGAIGRRNVLVANRQRLHPDGYTLAGLEADVSALRRRRPVEEAPWHSDASAMLPQLRERLRGGVSLVDSSPEDLIAPIRAFCAEVVQPYLAGEVADLGAAFETLPPGESSAFFDMLMDRSAILYRPADPPHGAVAFVATRDEHQAYVTGKGQQVDPISLPILDREWLGVLRVLPGGAVPTFGLDELEGQRHAPPLAAAPAWAAHQFPAPSAYAPASPAPSPRGRAPSSSFASAPSPSGQAEPFAQPARPTRPASRPAAPALRLEASGPISYPISSAPLSQPLAQPLAQPFAQPFAQPVEPPLGMLSQPLRPWPALPSEPLRPLEPLPSLELLRPLRPPLPSEPTTPSRPMQPVRSRRSPDSEWPK